MNARYRSLAFGAVMILSSASMAQGIKLQEICSTYAGRPIAMRGTTAITRSCAEIKEIAERFQLNATSFAKVRESFKRQAGLNIHDAKENGFPEYMKCKIAKSAAISTISCSFTMFQSPATMVYSGGSSGFIDKLSVTVNDFRDLLKPMIDGMDEKQGTRALPLSFDLMLDILVAKNNAIAPSEETYSRTGSGMSVTILNVYSR